MEFGRRTSGNCNGRRICIMPTTSSLDLVQKSQCGASEVFHFLNISTSKLRNDGNDAIFEMQAFLASLCLTDEQRQQLEQGISLHPVLPSI